MVNANQNLEGEARTPRVRSSILRARPTQARSRKTFDAILTAAAELLTEKGWEGFNTNLLAERAGCRVATLYRYFPDKLAVVSTLAQRVVADWDREFEEIALKFADATDLREVWPAFAQQFVSILKHNPSTLAVRKAMQAVPELRAIDQEDNERLAQAFAETFCQHLPGLSGDRAMSAARLMIETEVAVVDLAMSTTEPEAKLLLEDLAVMHRAFLDRLYATHGDNKGGERDA